MNFIASISLDFYKIIAYIGPYRSGFICMEDFFKYVNPGKDDIEWGLSLNSVGLGTVSPGVTYPMKEHPTGYYFSYQRGRILDEYQLLYITEGEGIYENQTGRYKISPGSLLITKPGDWHRYKPKKSVGWKENYVGFKGPFAVNMFLQPWFRKQKPVIDIGIREEIIDTYYKIFEYVKEEKPGYQQVSAGMVMKLLGYIVSIDKQKGFSGKRVEQIIQKACFMIRENVESDIDFKNFADCHNIGYSYFRKMFKKYTGVPPVQYHLELKLLTSQGNAAILRQNYQGD